MEYAQQTGYLPTGPDNTSGTPEAVEPTSDVAYGTPEGELEFRKKRCKEFFEKHSISPAELYKYDMTKPLE
jgi:hypothetical protein